MRVAIEVLVELSFELIEGNRSRLVIGAYRAIPVGIVLRDPVGAAIAPGDLVLTIVGVGAEHGPTRPGAVANMVSAVGDFVEDVLSIFGVAKTVVIGIGV